MHVAEQFQIDFAKLEADRPLFEQIERNRAADAHNWTDEAMAMVWFLGRSDWEVWRSLPSYERNRVVSLYQAEQSDLQWRIETGRVFKFEDVELEGGAIWRRKVILKHGRIRSYREAYHPVSREELDQFNWRVENMTKQLEADWSANRPPSVFTYDTSIAAAVSSRLGRRVEAIPRKDQLT